MTIELFNPYHDRRGRFSTRQGGSKVTLHRTKMKDGTIALQYNSRAGEVVGVDVDERTMFEFIRANEDLHDRLSNDYRGEFPKTDILIGDARRLGDSRGGFFSLRDKTIFLDKQIAGGFRSRGVDKELATFALIHEKFHSRGHNKNRLSLDTILSYDKDKRRDVYNREEGLNSILAERYYRQRYNGEPFRMYDRQTNVVANYFLGRAGGDKKKAFEMIKDAHKKGYDYPVSYDDMQRTAGGNSSIAYGSLITARDIGLNDGSNVLRDIESMERLIVDDMDEYQRVTGEMRKLLRSVRTGR